MSTRYIRTRSSLDASSEVALGTMPAQQPTSKRHRGLLSGWTSILRSKATLGAGCTPSIRHGYFGTRERAASIEPWRWQLRNGGPCLGSSVLPPGSDGDRANPRHLADLFDGPLTRPHAG